MMSITLFIIKLFVMVTDGLISISEDNESYYLIT